MEAGTLQVDGILSTTPVTVGAEGTLGGNGIIQTNTSVQGKLAPGDGVGTLSFNAALTWSGPSTGFLWDISSWTGAPG